MTVLHLQTSQRIEVYLCHPDSSHGPLTFEKGSRLKYVCFGWKKAIHPAEPCD